MLSIVKKFQSFDQTCRFKPTREYFQLILKFLSELFSSSSGALNIYNSDIVRGEGYFTNADEGDYYIYANHFLQSNPMSIEFFFNQKLVNKPVLRSILNSHRNCYPDKLFDLLVRKGVYQSLLVLIKCNNDSYAFLSLDRGFGLPEYTEHDLVLLNDLTPFIANSINANLTYQKLNSFIQLFMSIPIQESLIFFDKTTKEIIWNQETSNLWKKLNPDCTINRFIDDTLDKLVNQNNEFYLYDAENNSYKFKLFKSPLYDSIQVLMISPEGTEVMLDNNILSILTPKEKKIVDLLTRGYTNKDIGNILCISENTVKVHLRNVFERTGVKRRTELINKVICGKMN